MKEEKKSLFVSFSKSIAVIFKWLVILGIISIVLYVLFGFFSIYFSERYRYGVGRYDEVNKNCSQQCKLPGCINPPDDAYKCDKEKEECYSKCMLENWR